MSAVEMGLDFAAIAARLEPGIEAHAVRHLLVTPVAGERADDAEDDEPAPGLMSPEDAALSAMADRRQSDRREG